MVDLNSIAVSAEISEAARDEIKYVGSAVRELELQREKIVRIAELIGAERSKLKRNELIDKTLNTLRAAVLAAVKAVQE